MDQILDLLKDANVLQWLGATVAGVPYVGGVLSVVLGIFTKKGKGPEPWKRFPVVFKTGSSWGVAISKKMRGVPVIGPVWEFGEDYILGPPVALFYGIFVGANKDDK